MYKYLQQFKLIIFAFVLLLCWSAIYAQDSSLASDELILENELCGLLREKAALAQFCYQLTTSIVLYKQVLEVCPDDYLSRHQMGLSYFLLGDIESGSKMIDEAIESASDVGDLALIKTFRNEKDNWLKNFSEIDLEVIEKEKSKMAATHEECDLLLNEPQD
ncbi:MAG: hypothetical protein AB2563_10815 [Candidatus Thiodiazotropha endolucinida]